MEKFSLDKLFQSISNYWIPSTASVFNNQALKAIKILGQFPNHKHEDNDTLLIIYKGNVKVIIDEQEYNLCANDILMIPAYQAHQIHAQQEAWILVCEPFEAKCSIPAETIRE